MDLLDLSRSRIVLNTTQEQNGRVNCFTRLSRTRQQSWIPSLSFDWPVPITRVDPKPYPKLRQLHATLLSLGGIRIRFKAILMSTVRQQFLFSGKQLSETQLLQWSTVEGRAIRDMDELNLWDDTMLIVKNRPRRLLGEHDWCRGKRSCLGTTNRKNLSRISRSLRIAWDPRAGVQNGKSFRNWEQCGKRRRWQ